MGKSTSTEASFDIPTDELLAEYKAHLVRAALAHEKLTHKEFCERHGLNRSIFSQVLNRQQVPAPHYAKPIEELLREHIRKMRFTLSKVDTAQSADPKA